MLKIDRHSYILNELKNKHLVRVSNLANDMKVTEMTIRRDLQELEDYGHLTRIHGGAKLKPKNFYQEDNYNKKISVNVEEKKQIARKVSEIIKDNETIFIGPGSTTSYLAEYLQDRDINIVTNSLTVFEQFKDNPSCDLIFIGGRYRQKTKGFIGYFTQDALSKISVNKAFVGVNGIDLEKVTIGWAAVPVSALFWLYEIYVLKRKESIMLYDRLLNMRVVTAIEQPKVVKEKEDKEN